MNPSETNRIERRIELKVPASRVWKALTGHKEFGEWFRVNLASPFEPGRESKGRVTYPGYEHAVMRVIVQRMEAERVFSFLWHPYAVDPKADYSKEKPTLVEFVLAKTASGTLLTVTESGFDSIPSGRRDEAFRMNSAGWTEQMSNIERHVGTTS